MLLLIFLDFCLICTFIDQGWKADQLQHPFMCICLFVLSWQTDVTHPNNGVKFSHGDLLCSLHCLNHLLLVLHPHTRTHTHTQNIDQTKQWPSDLQGAQSSAHTHTYRQNKYEQTSRAHLTTVNSHAYIYTHTCTQQNNINLNEPAPCIYLGCIEQI